MASVRSNGADFAAVLPDGLPTEPALIWSRSANTTPYSANGVIGSVSTGHLQLSNVAPAGSMIFIVTAQLYINRATIPTGMDQFRVNLWSAQPAAVVADGGPYQLTQADRPRDRGYILLPKPEIRGVQLFSANNQASLPVLLAPTSTSLWFNLQSLVGFTPESGTEYELRFQCITLGVRQQ